jgi:transcriptional regulator with XRE-family HTH domain
VADVKKPAVRDAQGGIVESTVTNMALRLRELRLHQDLTLQQLGKRAGLSSASIHKIEHNGMVPTITTLLKLAEAFDRPVAYFLDEAPDHAGPVALTPAADRPRAFGSGPGVDAWSVSGSYGGFRLDGTVTTIAPGACGDPSASRHGEELVYVLAGSLLYDVDGHAYRLEAGDCLHLRTDLPHHWANPGTEPAEALWVRPRR